MTMREKLALALKEKINAGQFAKPTDGWIIYTLSGAIDCLALADVALGVLSDDAAKDGK